MPAINATACSLSPRPFNRQLRNQEAGAFKRAGHNSIRLMHRKLAFAAGDVIVDVGSYEGADLMRVAEGNPEAVVHSFDPQPPQRLWKNVKPYRNVHVHTMGVGGTKCEAASVEPPPAAQSFSLRISHLPCLACQSFRVLLTTGRARV